MSSNHNGDDNNHEKEQKQTTTVEFLKSLAKDTPEPRSEEEILTYDTRLTRRQRSGNKIHCRFFIPHGRGRKQVGRCKIPISQPVFQYKPDKVKGEKAEYYIRYDLLDENFHKVNKRSSQLVADFWLNNPSQIDYSKYGRDIIADGREIALLHHRFIGKNMLEQNVMIYIALAMVMAIGMVIAMGYAATIRPETTQIITLPDGTQFIYKNNQQLATGKGIAPLPQAVIDKLNEINNTEGK